MCVFGEKAGIVPPPGGSVGTPLQCLRSCEGAEVLAGNSSLGLGLPCWRCLGKSMPNFPGSPASTLSLKSPPSSHPGWGNGVEGEETKKDVSLYVFKGQRVINIFFGLRTLLPDMLLDLLSGFLAGRYSFPLPSHEHSKVWRWSQYRDVK